MDPAQRADMRFQKLNNRRAILLRPGRIHGDAVELIGRDDFHRVTESVETLVDGDIRVWNAKEAGGDGAGFQRTQARRSAAGNHRKRVVARILESFALEIIGEDRSRAAPQSGNADAGAAKIFDLLVSLAADEN